MQVRQLQARLRHYLRHRQRPRLSGSAVPRTSLSPRGRHLGQRRRKRHCLVKQRPVGLPGKKATDLLLLWVRSTYYFAVRVLPLA